MRYLFEDFVLDVEKHELRRGEKLIAVEPQVFALLAHLIGQRERVVSREELIETIWEGRFVSESVVSSRIKSARKVLGDDGRTQSYIKTIHGTGFRFVAAVEDLDGADRFDRVALNAAINAGPTAASISPSQTPMAWTNQRQSIRFCKTADGVQIAYAKVGEGPPIVKTANWLNHLEFDWESPVWRHIFRACSTNHQFVRYDARGNGLSDWRVNDFSIERQVEDLEAVVDAAGLDQFPLLGISQGCAISVVYAARHPEKVTKLILYGGYARGWRKGASHDYRKNTEAMITLVRNGWGQDNPAFRQLFASLFMPDAPPENHDWFNELQRKTTSPENAATLLETLGDVDVRESLAKVLAPTLVIHASGDMRVPFEAGKELVAGIPDARFMSLETNNHLIPESDPAWPRFRDAIFEFLAD